jgi:hypothetical protein
MGNFVCLSYTKSITHSMNASWMYIGYIVGPM